MAASGQAPLPILSFCSSPLAADDAALAGLCSPAVLEELFVDVNTPREEGAALDAVLRLLGSHGMSSAVGVYSVLCKLGWPRGAHAVVLWWLGASFHTDGPATAAGGTAAPSGPPALPDGAPPAFQDIVDTWTKAPVFVNSAVDLRWKPRAAAWAAASWGAWPMVAGLLQYGSPGGLTDIAMLGGERVYFPLSLHHRYCPVPPGSADAVAALVGPLRDQDPSIAVREGEAAVWEDVLVPHTALARLGKEAAPPALVPFALQTARRRPEEKEVMSWSRGLRVQMVTGFEKPFFLGPDDPYTAFSYSSGLPTALIAAGLLAICGHGPAAEWGLAAIREMYPTRLAPILAYLGRLEELQGIVEGVEASTRDSLLHLAAAGGAVDVVRWRLEGGQHPNDLDPYSGMPAMTLAGASGSLECVQVLLGAGAEAGLVWNDTDAAHTGAHTAVAMGHLDIAEAILAAGGNLQENHTTQDVEVRDGLSIALASGAGVHPDVLQWVLDRPEADTLKPSEYELGSAGEVKALMWLFGRGYLDSPTQQLAAVDQAILYGGSGAGEALIGAGFAFDMQQGPVPHGGFFRGNASPVATAACEGRVALLQALLDAGASADVKARGYTPLGLCLCKAELPIDCIHLLLAAGADVNATNNAGNVPITCVACSHAGLTRALLEAGADVTVKGGRGRDVITVALCESSTSVVPKDPEALRLLFAQFTPAQVDASVKAAMRALKGISDLPGRVRKLAVRAGWVPK